MSILKFFSLDNLVIYIWILNVLVQLVSGSFSLFISNTFLITLFFYFILFVFIIKNFKYIKICFCLEDLIFFNFIVFSVLFTFLFFPLNEVALIDALKILPMGICFYVVGKVFYNVEDIEIKLASISRYGIIIAALALLITMDTNKSMSFAYNVLPLVICVDYGFFYISYRRYFIYVLAGNILLFFLGTRGPVLFTLLYLAYEIFKKCKSLKSRFFLLIGSILTFILIVSDYYLVVIDYIYQVLLDYGYQSYILRQFVENNTTSMDIRFSFIEMLWNQIIYNPIVGHGLCGDIVLLGSYSHNIIFELLYSYGLCFGIIIIVFFAFFLIRLKLNLNKVKKYTDFFCILIFSIVFKFFFSSSFIRDVDFYFVSGIFIGLSHYTKLKIAGIKCTSE